MSDTRPRRRWARLSVRTLVVLVLLAGLGLGGIATRVRTARRQREAVEAIVKLHGSVDYEPSSPRHWGPRMRIGPLFAWLRDRLGDDFFDRVTHATITDQAEVTDSDVAHLAALPDLEDVRIDHVPVTDAGLAPLAVLKRLRRLRLTDVPITDAAVASLARLPRLTDLTLDRTRIGDAILGPLGRMPQLRMLSLQWTRVTDAGLARLAGLKRLEVLDLTCTEVTDAALVPLRGLTSLKSLALGATRVTAEGKASIEAALPGCQITWWRRHGDLSEGSGGPNIPEPRP